MTVSEWQLDPRLAADGPALGDLALCRVTLVDAADFPWVTLVPRQPGRVELIDLPEADQQQLMREVALVSRVMQAAFSPDKLNVAALGNVVPQLHVHVIARHQTDPAWPAPVFGHSRTPYLPEQRAEQVRRLKLRLFAEAGKTPDQTFTPLP